MSEDPKRPAKRPKTKRPAGNAAGKPAPETTVHSKAPEPAAAVASATEGEAPSAPAPFPIVGIGASAGGLAAIEAFFSAMPSDEETGIAFVVVQHLSPDHKSLLVDVIGRYTRMQVYNVENGMKIRPGCTYIIPPNHNLSLVGQTLHLERYADAHRPQLTIDHFFHSLAAAQGERAICVVLSGTGTDGTLGVRNIKDEGGLVFVQSPDTADYDGMPRSAIATGLVDYVLPPAEIPGQLIAYVRHAFDPMRRPPEPPVRDGLLKRVCALLRAQTGHDFSQYKESTLLRRIERRMTLHQMEDPDEYHAYAREHSAELEALFRDLLIGVTEFFRDQEAYNVLDGAIPQIIAGKDAHDPVRVWVVGCSTGEEAYSIAMLLAEHQLRAKHPFKIQIFATDINRLAIERARAGIYPASIAARVPGERLSRFFEYDAESDTYRVQKYLRDLVVFSEQDVIKDPPFSRLDLLCCRNLLIYLKAELQRKLIALFHYALRPSGILFLGTSETVGDLGRMFQTIDRKWKVYTRLPAENGERARLPDFVPPLIDVTEKRLPIPPAVKAADRAEPGGLRQLTERALLAHYAQAGVLTNSHGDILHIVGRTGKFLEPADGDAAMNILSMAREGLRREVTVALHNAVTRKQLVSYPGLKVKANGDYIRANLTVRPVESGDSLLYLVILEEVLARAADLAPATGIEAQDSRVADLELELRAKDEYLQTTLEEMETTNEELKSTNEEMQSINEELQSTNEELETSKEELPVNEELSTVNAELQDKVNDLSRANNDMNNLLAGTGVGTVFVDHDLRITRFTPAATQVINLIASDLGRPLEHVASNFTGYDLMIEDIRSVLGNLAPKEVEVQVKTGAWYLMGIRPYRTMENQIRGAVITLVDITGRKKAEAQLRSSEARLNLFINQAFAGVAETDLTGKLLFVNDRLCGMLGYGRDELMSRRLADITEPGDLPRVQAKLDALMNSGSHIQLDKQYVCKDGTRLHVHERVSVIRDNDGKAASLLLLSFEPVEGERPH